MPEIDRRTFRVSTCTKRPSRDITQPGRVPGGTCQCALRSCRCQKDEMVDLCPRGRALVCGYAVMGTIVRSLSVVLVLCDLLPNEPSCTEGFQVAASSSTCTFDGNFIDGIMSVTDVTLTGSPRFGVRMLRCRQGLRVRSSLFR